MYAGIGEMPDLKGIWKMIAIIDYDCDYFLKSPIKKAFVRYKMK